MVLIGAHNRLDYFFQVVMTAKSVFGTWINRINLQIQLIHYFRWKLIPKLLKMSAGTIMIWMNLHLLAMTRSWKFGTRDRKWLCKALKLMSPRSCQLTIRLSTRAWWSQVLQIDLWLYGIRGTWRLNFSVYASTKTKSTKLNSADRFATCWHHAVETEELWFGTWLGVVCHRPRKRREMDHLSWFSSMEVTPPRYLTSLGTWMRDSWWHHVQKIISYKSGK